MCCWWSPAGRAAACQAHIEPQNRAWWQKRQERLRSASRTAVSCSAGRSAAVASAAGSQTSNHTHSMPSAREVPAIQPLQKERTPLGFMATELQLSAAGPSAPQEPIRPTRAARGLLWSFKTCPQLPLWKQNQRSCNANRHDKSPRSRRRRLCQPVSPAHWLAYSAGSVVHTHTPTVHAVHARLLRSRPRQAQQPCCAVVGQ